MFQSHNGAIAACVLDWSFRCRRLFQSHNGAIAARLVIPSSSMLTKGFNPTMVRLLPCKRETAHGKLPSFNPTMVRLLLPPLSFSDLELLQFQSHNGAIAATLPAAERWRALAVSIPQWCDCCPSGTTTGSTASSRFNPTMVRLLLTVAVLTVLQRICFNPTMVRLLHGCCVVRRQPKLRFQSHNGAIAARTAQNRACWNCKFQSHNGAIAAVRVR